MATTQFVIADNVDTQLATAASSSATTLTLASSANLPTLSAGQVMPITLNDAATESIYEICYVTAISGVTLTVTRAQEGTGAQNWAVGDFAFCAPTSGTVAMVNGSPSNQFYVAAATASNEAPQLAQVQSGASSYAVDTGTANTYVVALTPAIAAYSDGLKIRFKAKTANTGASTLNVNSLGATTLYGKANVALQGGEIPANGYCEAEYNSSLPGFALIENTGGAQQVAAAMQSGHAVQLGQNTGRMLGQQALSSSGTYTAPAGTTMVWVRGWGSGSGGAGSTTTATGQSGNGAGYFEGYYPYTGPVAVTVGAAGTAGSAGSTANGGNGATTSYGALGSATGGTSSGAGTGIGGLLNITGTTGQGATSTVGGAGGAAFSAAGGSGHATTGSPGMTPGGGGASAGNSGSTAAVGGAGGGGLLIAVAFGTAPVVS